MVENRTGDGWCTQKLGTALIVFHASYFQRYKSVLLEWMLWLEPFRYCARKTREK
jgi:hypothetical protein